MGHDIQMQYIKNLVWQNRERISAADEPHAEVTYMLYEHIRDYILQIVDKKYVKFGKIVILGGLQINVEPEDYFEPKIFICIDEKGDT